MKLSDLGLQALAHLEGKKLKAYKDTSGVWTIGVGHTDAAGPPEVKAGMKITSAQADEILRLDLAQFEREVNGKFANVPQFVFDGAVIFDFNTGAFSRASWPESYLRGSMSMAETQLKLWIKSHHRTVKGLVNRRQAEADMIFRNRYPS